MTAPVRIAVAGALLGLTVVLAFAMSGEESASAQGTVNFDVDPETTGNSANTLGTVEDCYEVTCPSAECTWDGSSSFDGTSDYNIDIVVIGDTRSPEAYDVSVIYAIVDGGGGINDGCPQVGDTPESGDECLNRDDDDGDYANGDYAINDGCPQVGATAEKFAQCRYDEDDDGDAIVHVADPGTDTVIKMPPAPGRFDPSDARPDTDGTFSAGVAYLNVGESGTPGNGTLVRIGLDIGGSGLVTFVLDPPPLAAYASNAGVHPTTVGSGQLAINTTCPAAGFTLGMVANPPAGGTTHPTPGSHTYDPGTVVPITATPSAGYRFDSWTGDPDCADGSVTMNANKACTANFIQTFTLTMAVSPAGGGTTDPAVGPHTYDSGTVVPIIATRSADYRFGSWTGDADCADGSVTMNANKACTANFRPMGAIIDYAVRQLSPSYRSFTNPPPARSGLVVYRVRVQNVGTASDGPVSLSLSFTRVNATCSAPRVIPPQQLLTLKPGESTTRTFFVRFFHCGNVSNGTTDYIATARVSAPDDGNPDNDTMTGTVDVRKSRRW